VSGRPTAGTVRICESTRNRLTHAAADDPAFNFYQVHPGSTFSSRSKAARGESLHLAPINAGITRHMIWSFSIVN
jgi:hypothetical protein